MGFKTFLIGCVFVLGTIVPSSGTDIDYQKLMKQKNSSLYQNELSLNQKKRLQKPLTAEEKEVLRKIIADRKNPLAEKKISKVQGSTEMMISNQHLNGKWSDQYNQKDYNGISPSAGEKKIIGQGRSGKDVRSRECF